MKTPRLEFKGKREKKASRTSSFLGIECGGSRSIALLTRGSALPAIHANFGPANLHLLTDEELIEHFTKINAIRPPDSPPLTGVVIGMAGVRRPSDSERIRQAADKVWPDVPCYATNDLETALVAEETTESNSIARVLILSGTGSCCFGRTPEGKTIRYGGWGHVLGDRGSGYDIGLNAIKAVARELDDTGVWPQLGQSLLQALILNEPDDLIGFVKSADKSEIAALAIPVFDAAAKHDKIATTVINQAAEDLVADGINCARCLVRPGAPVEFILAGSILLKRPSFARQVRARVLQLWPTAVVTTLRKPSIWGAIELARQHFGSAEDKKRKKLCDSIQQADIGAAAVPDSIALSPTEQRNPRSLKLDKLPLVEAVELMIDEESKVSKALLREKKKIEQAVKLVVQAFRAGGRLFYVGAGTSGRLAILDSSECPPTFRTPPERVQGIIAGGHTALWKSVEGAEDDSLAGGRAIEFRGINKRDIVVGIAASGRTPFVWGALAEARKRGATTVLLCFNPNIRIAPENKPDLVLSFNVDPEVLTGSTRLKAGTATKIVLNILTTLSMVQMGKVMSNLMVDLNASNFKLRERAVRIVQAITGTEAEIARDALEKSRWLVKTACQRLR